MGGVCICLCCCHEVANQNANTNYTIQRLRTNVPLELDSVTTENIQNYFRKVRHYMFAYLQGYAGGTELEKKSKE